VRKLATVKPSQFAAMRRCSMSRYVQYRSVSRLAYRHTDRFYVSRICNARLLPDCWLLYQFDGSFANLCNKALATASAAPAES
jgi:hypothetical protein